MSDEHAGTYQVIRPFVWTWSSVHPHTRVYHEDEHDVTVQWDPINHVGVRIVRDKVPPMFMLQAFVNSGRQLLERDVANLDRSSSCVVRVAVPEEVAAYVGSEPSSGEQATNPRGG